MQFKPQPALMKSQQTFQSKAFSYTNGAFAFFIFDSQQVSHETPPPSHTRRKTCALKKVKHAWKSVEVSRSVKRHTQKQWSVGDYYIFE